MKGRMKEGFYVIFGRQEGRYRIMDDAKGDDICTKKSMVKAKPRTAGGHHLLDIAYCASRHLLITSRIKDPRYIRGKEGDWVLFGPVRPDKMHLEDEKGHWDDVYDDMKMAMPGTGLIMIVGRVCQQRNAGRPYMCNWTDE